MFGERNAARIANGLGGTINLIASVGMILLMLTGMAFLGIHNRFFGFTGPVDRPTVLAAIAIAAFGVIGGVFMLTIGARHLGRVEV